MNYTNGILFPRDKRYKMERQAPTKNLEKHLEFFWQVEWDFQNRDSQTIETLPAPTVHILFYDKAVNLSGPIDKKFSYKMTGRGWVFGVKFLPGAFTSFFNIDLQTIPDSGGHCTSMILSV